MSWCSSVPLEQLVRDTRSQRAQIPQALLGRSKSATSFRSFCLGQSAIFPAARGRLVSASGGESNLPPGKPPLAVLHSPRQWRVFLLSG